MTYHLKGIEPQTRKNAGLRALTLGGVVKPPKPRKPRKRGYTVNRQEDKIRTDIIKELRKHGYKVWRVEPSFRGKFGLGDLWVMHKRGVASWLDKNHQMTKHIVWIKAKELKDGLHRKKYIAPLDDMTDSFMTMDEIVETRIKSEFGIKPQQVFSYDDLRVWAETHGFVHLDYVKEWKKE